MISGAGGNKIAYFTMDTKERAYLRGKATELAMLINRDNTRGRNRFFDFMFAIEIFKQLGEISEKLVELVKMKDSMYRDLLIEHNIWTVEIFGAIRARVITKIL